MAADVDKIVEGVPQNGYLVVDVVALYVVGCDVTFAFKRLPQLVERLVVDARGFVAQPFHEGVKSETTPVVAVAYIVSHYILQNVVDIATVSTVDKKIHSLVQGVEFPFFMMRETNSCHICYF